jgi:hypothetical protein
MEIPQIKLQKDEKPVVETTEHVINVHTALLNALVEVLMEKGIITEDELVMKAATSGSKPIHHEEEK